MSEGRKRPVQREWADQRRDTAFLSKALPADAYWSAIDVGSAGSARQGQLRKARGVKAGLPDFLVVHRNITVWIERKSGSNLSEAQRLTRDALTANGHLWALARSTEDIEAALRDAGIPLRATVGEIHNRVAAQNARLGKKPRRPRAKAPRPLNSMTIAQYHRLNQKGLF